MTLLLLVLILSSFLGIELIRRIPSQLHTPLMSGSNAISGITLVGAILATSIEGDWAKALEYTERLEKLANRDLAPRRAHYLCEQAEQLIAEARAEVAAELGLEPEALAHDGESLTDHAREHMGRRTGSKVSR